MKHLCGFVLIASLAIACKPEVNKLLDIRIDPPVSSEERAGLHKQVLAVAQADIRSVSGSTLEGLAIFTQAKKGEVKLSLHISDARPGKHAVCIYDQGNCSDTDTFREGEIYHRGDIGDVVVDRDSTGVLEVTITGWSIGNHTDPTMVGKTLIIHEGGGDPASREAAGSRIGCGVIKKI